MTRPRIENSLLVACLLSYAAAQDEAETCYGPGSVVGAVVGTLIVTLALLGSSYFLYKMFWKNRKGKHLVLMSDAENPNDQYAFDNPCFREATPIKHSIQDEKQTSKLEKSKWPGWPPLHTFGREKNGKITSMDDSHVNDSRLKVVTLKSHDFTGLGFNICGNMRDGIFVKDVLHRGPAFESGCINSGDRIDSVCISFRNMVFEDALAILSYASPYDVQVQMENDSYSRPSTLIRSKRESNAVSSAERILHPKYNRSQSSSHLNEIGKGNNKKMAHQIGFMLEKNRINQSLNKSGELITSSHDYPTMKVSAAGHDARRENHKNATPKVSPMAGSKSPDSNNREFESHRNRAPGEPQNKHQKFGIKVLPISINPKMGVQSVTGAKKPSKSPTTENEINQMKEKPEKPEKPAKLKLQESSSRSTSPSGEEKEHPGMDEPDSNKENVKAILAKGFQNLKEKINQNTLGRKKTKDAPSENNADEEPLGSPDGGQAVSNGLPEEKASEGDCPVPKLRSTVACGVKAYEKSHQQNHINVPEEVTRAGDVARNNRRSTAEARSLTNLAVEPEAQQPDSKSENMSDSESASDRDSTKASDEAKRPKRSKGKAPAPPHADVKSNKQQQGLTPKDVNEIKKESELVKDEKMSIFEPDAKMIPLKDDGDDIERNHQASYDSDSDVEPVATPKDTPNTKIELNATQVTVHQSPAGDGNDEEIEPSRKAASLGDLSKLDSEQPLSIVLERAVSLYLTDGGSQCGKKRKAPLPPSEEFPAVFDDLTYRKEPRLENSLGLNTFQRRLKKSSDFGTLEDALCDGPKSLEIEVNKHAPLDLSETHNYNIQEFSSWLAECRRPKTAEDQPKEAADAKPKISSTSLVNINSSDSPDRERDAEYQGGNVSFSVNGKNFPDFEISNKPSAETVNFPGTNSRTVVVISQPNSLEPTTIVETVPVNYPEEAKVHHQESANGEEAPREAEAPEEDATPPKLPTSPMPVMSASSTLSSPLSSSLTYITEIKVSTTEQEAAKKAEAAEREADVAPTDSEKQSVSEKIQRFDKPMVSPKGFLGQKLKDEGIERKDGDGRRENHFGENSKIPIRAMKSETGQKVLATIQSLAKESSPTKTPEVEYAKRVASLFSGTPHKNQLNVRKTEMNENEVNRPNISGLYLKGTPPKPSKDYSPTRKVPPVVPPRKMETSLTGKATVTVELPSNSSSPGESPQDRNIVTFSSFTGNGNAAEDAGTPSRISFKFKEHGELNGGGEGVVPVKTSATKIVFESNEGEDGL